MPKPMTSEQKANRPRHIGDINAYPIDRIEIEPGFNVRKEGPGLDAHIRWLADQIKAFGFDQTQPLAVKKNPDKPGYVLVRKGHCRFMATHLAISEGADIVSMPTTPEPQGSNVITQTYQLGTSNSGKNLSYLEYAVIIMRLRGYGQTDEQIINGFKKDRAWLNNVLTLNEASPEVHKMVDSGKIAQTEALKIVRREGSHAPAKVREAIEHAEGRRKKRATAQDVEAVTKPREEAPSIYSATAAFLEAYASESTMCSLSYSVKSALDILMERFGIKRKSAA
jgi:ParB family transcriptional regulator, chromosome partitioning protein